MTIKEWTDNNYLPLKQACERISENSPLAEELLHYVLSEFLLKQDVSSIIMSGNAFFYCLRIATNSWKSTTSPFYRTYRDPNYQCVIPDLAEQSPEEEQDWDALWAQTQEKIEQLGWYEQELLKVYAENNGNASLVSRLTKIPRTSINLTIRKIKSHIKDTLTETNGRQNNKIDMKEIVYYMLGDHEEVLQSERWCLEGQIQEDKFRLGLGPYAEYKEIPNYAPPEPHPELATYISSICDSTKPTVVPKKPRSRKTKQTPVELSTLQHILDESDSTNTSSEYIKDRTDRSNPTVSNGMDQ